MHGRINDDINRDKAGKTHAAKDNGRVRTSLSRARTNRLYGKKPTRYRVKTDNFWPDLKD